MFLDASNYKNLSIFRPTLIVFVKIINYVITLFYNYLCMTYLTRNFYVFKGGTWNCICLLRRELVLRSIEPAAKDDK